MSNDFSDQQWERIRKHFPEEHIADDRPGRKPVPTRRVLEAVLWILNTGAQWHMLPQSYPNYTYMLWLDEQLTPHLRLAKPLTEAELATAKWGIGGQRLLAAGW